MMTAEPRSERPTWRRFARVARDWIYRIGSIVEALTVRDAHAIVPPAHLRFYYYRTWKREAFSRAAKGAALELMSRGLLPEHRLLDIGSGIGNLAVGLLGSHWRGSYDGLEIHPEAVAWCQHAITPRHPEFRFHRADVFSHAYNRQGGAVASEYRFPFADQQFDFVFLGSVFTHLLPDAVAHYVHEIARVLAPGGICVASCFLLNEASRAGLDAGRGFMSFEVEQPSALCRLHDPSVPESAVALNEEFVRRILGDAGLQLRDVRRGSWWSGVSDDQDVLTAVRISPPVA